MKILFCSSKRWDYQQDLLYSGLTEVLGENNVIEFPFHFPYHLPGKTYPKNMGYAGSGLNLNLKQEWARLSLPFHKYDLVIVASCRTDCLAYYLDKMSKIPDNIPRIFLDGGDREEICGDAVRFNSTPIWDAIQKKRPFDLVLKREYVLNRSYTKEVEPFPFCVNVKSYPKIQNVESTRQVVFWATESHPIRTKAFEILQNHFDCRENGSVKNQTWENYKFKGARYFQEFSKAAISLNLRGGGWDTLRYWETPLLGPFMVTQKPQILIPNNFEDGIHVAFCDDDLSNLIEICQYYLQNKEKRLSLARAAHEHLLKYHTNVERAKTLLHMINTRFNIGAENDLSHN